MEHNWGVSVIVCCHNSAHKLPATLNAVFELKRGPFPIEVIVVDNNSSDDTAETALECARRHRVDYLRVICEKEPGLSYARRAGIVAAQYEVLIFCDDDNHLCEGYAMRAFSLFASNPEIGAIGGIGTGLLEGQTPPWWSMYSKSYALGPQADKNGPVRASRGYVYGAGMCVRKSIMMRLMGYNFEPLLKDRSGRELTSGGDVEICFLIRAMGYEIWYDEDLKFDHIIDKSRLTWSYYLGLKRGISRSFPVAFSFRLFNRLNDVSAIDFALHYLRAIRSMLKLYFAKGDNQYRIQINRLVAKSSLEYLVLRPFLMIRTFGRVKKIVTVLRAGN
jgi:glycosyltransferase involved in cell wall biosynthesis